MNNRDKRKLKGENSQKLIKRDGKIVYSWKETNRKRSEEKQQNNLQEEKSKEENNHQNYHKPTS